MASPLTASSHQQHRLHQKPPNSQRPPHPRRTPHRQRTTTDNLSTSSFLHTRGFLPNGSLRPAASSPTGSIFSTGNLPTRGILPTDNLPTGGVISTGSLPFDSGHPGFFLAIICAISYYRVGQRKIGARTSKREMDLRRLRFVLFGDSITEQSFRPGGWGAALANTYARKADIIVRGYGGYNTRWALFLLNHVFPLNCSGAPAVTTIFFGANDAAILGRASERQHVPVEEYKENLRKVVHHLKECSPTMLVILITPPPIDEDGRNKYARSLYGDKARELPERTNEMVAVYAKNCIELAKEMSLPYVDLWSNMQETVGWQKKLLSDGLHLTPEGNAVVHKEVVDVLHNAHLSPEDLPFDSPHHSLIDGKEPEMAFKKARE